MKKEINIMKIYKDRKGQYQRVYLQQYINEVIEVSKLFNDEKLCNMLVEHKTKQFVKDHGTDGFFKRYIVEPMTKEEELTLFDM